MLRSLRLLAASARPPPPPPLRAAPSPLASLFAGGLTPARAFGAEEHGAKLIRPKPTTPGRRHLIRIDRSELWRFGPFRGLVRGKTRICGRNNRGRVTIRRRGGGHKRKYRIVDFKRSVVDTPGVVQRLEYDPNRSAYLALVLYPDQRIHYIIAPDGVKPGDSVTATRSRALPLRPGNAMPLRFIPIGVTVHCVELHTGRGAQLARAAGASAQLLDKNEGTGYATIRQTSREHRRVPLDGLATIGVVSNGAHKLRQLGKAGRSRWLGIRPHVRGEAMNPVDHPHGGRTRGGRPDVSPWGWPTKGFKTVRKISPFIVRERPRGKAKKEFM